MWLLVFLHTVSYALQFSAVGCLWLAVASVALVLTPHSCILKPQKPFSHCFLCLCSAAQGGPLEQPVLVSVLGWEAPTRGLLVCCWPCGVRLRALPYASPGCKAQTSTTWTVSPPMQTRLSHTACCLET